MKKSLAHLPDRKIDELTRIAAMIRESCQDVEMIILFGSYARGDWKEEADLAPDRKSGHPSDYDILVVTHDRASVRDSPLWERISRRCESFGLFTSVRIIVHDIKFLKQRLKELHYFFNDIVKEGCALYDSGQYELFVERELTPEEKFRVAKGHFEHWFEKAEVFFEDFQSNFSKAPERRYLSQAAFMLHQAAESTYKSLLLVFTNYTPYQHYLAVVDREASKILPSLADIFPRSTQAACDRFELFDYAYIGARYDPKFRISPEDLEYLSGCVQELMERTKRLCQEKLESLASDNRSPGV